MGKKVKAHQDDSKSNKELDTWAKANIRADQIMKDHLKNIINTEPPQYKPTKSKGWNIVLKEKVITRSFE